jgi:hypothetical protein
MFWEEEIIVNEEATTASEKPLMDYDPTRGQWFVNEPDAPALDNKDFTQIFDTDLNIKDKQRNEKEIVDFKGRENLQLALSSLKLSSPETYTDADDVSIQKKDDFDNRALQFRQEDSLSLVLPEDKLKGEVDVSYFPSPKVYQDINEDPGYADMAITADLKLSWEEEPKGLQIGTKVKLNMSLYRIRKALVEELQYFKEDDPNLENTAIAFLSAPGRIYHVSSIPSTHPYTVIFEDDELMNIAISTGFTDFSADELTIVSQPTDKSYEEFLSQQSSLKLSWEEPEFKAGDRVKLLVDWPLDNSKVIPAGSIGVINELPGAQFRYGDFRIQLGVEPWEIERVM